MKKSLLPVCLVASLLLTACEATHLVYVHESSLGVVLTPVSTQGTTKFSLGFDRETYALVPKAGKTADNAEAMSAAAVSRIQVKGITDLKFGHVVATGKAAAEITKNAEKLGAVQQQLFNAQTSSQ